MKEFTKKEQYLILKVFQNYYCADINEIADEDETAEGIFIKVGLIEGGINEKKQQLQQMCSQR